MSGKTIGQLTEATELDLTEEIEIEQAGGSKKVALNRLIGTTVITADYTANNFNENIIVNSASALTITIPADLAIGTFKAISRSISAITAITVAPSGSETIESVSSFITHGVLPTASMTTSEVVIKKKSSLDWGFTVPPVIRAEYANIVSTGTSVLNYSQKLEDSHNVVTVGSGWRFTAPLAGVYIIHGLLTANAYRRTFNLYRNGTIHRRLFDTTLDSFDTFYDFSVEVRLKAGDYIYIQGEALTANANAFIQIRLTA